MLEFDKLKKIICSNKPTSIDHLSQLSEKLKEDIPKSSVVNDLPKLLPVVFKYAFHEDVKFRKAAVPAFMVLSKFLDLNKHLKEKQWWTDMKESILKSVDVLLQLVTSADEDWSVLWCTTITLLGTDIRTEIHILNKLLKVLEKAFKMNSENERSKGFDCWCKLIDNFAINRQDLNSKRKLNLLVTPLRANNHNTAKLCVSKMQTWKHLLSKLDQHNELTVQLSVSHFLEFMFGNVGTLPPACKTLSADCANVFMQLLKTPVLFQMMPEQLIKYAFICIEHIHEDHMLALNVWDRILGDLWSYNSKHADNAEKLVGELMAGLKNSLSSDKFGKSKTFAEMVHSLYSGTNSMTNGILVKNYKTILSLALSPGVLVHFSESWCNDLLAVMSKTDLVLLPQNILGDIISQLAELSASDVYRKNQLKFLRGIWMSITNILCKWMTDDSHMSKNTTVQTDMDNAHKLLLFGAADLSSTWNKFQMKNWKILYSECVKYFSLLTEINSDKFVSDLVNLLLEGVQSSKIPLHVAVDIVSIILEFHLSKDASSILPLMLEIAERGMNALQHDVSGTSVLFSQYLKEIVGAARGEPALVTDILAVVDKMLDSEYSPSHDKIRNMILKAQHQLQSLKPNRTQEKSDSSGSSQTPPTSSPTMTSFLHRLAKAKEIKAKMTSPTTQPSETSSPSHTPIKKKVTSPFADVKSEDFVFVPPKTRKTILTDHQKETLSTRKHDIPALYQDLSQDSSQSALESIVTRVETIDEDVDVSQIVRSPKRHNNATELGLKVVPTKKSSEEKTDNKLLSNKENDCVNNNSKSPFSSIGKKNSLKTQDPPPKSVESLNNPEVEHIKQQSKAKKRLMPSLNDEKEQIQAVIVENINCNEVLDKGNESAPNSPFSSIGKKNNIKTQDTPKSVEKLRNPQTEKEDTIQQAKVKKLSMTSLNDKKEQIKVDRAVNKNCNEVLEKGKESTLSSKKSNIDTNAKVIETGTKNSPNEQTTPKRSLRKNKLNISVNKSGRKSIANNSIGSDLNPSTPGPDSEIKSPNMSKTPKISPRRLRKRKSGITPIISGSGIKKKRSSLSQTPTSVSDSPNTDLVQANVEKNSLTDENQSSNKSNIKNENDTALPDVSEEKVKITFKENECIHKKSKMSQQKDVATDLIQSENIKLCSPVKVVLDRLEVPVKRLCIDSDNEQETAVKKDFYSDKKDSENDTINEINGSLKKKANISNEMIAKPKDNLKSNDKHIDKEIQNEEISPSILGLKSGKDREISFIKTKNSSFQDKKLNKEKEKEDKCFTTEITPKQKIMNSENAPCTSESTVEKPILESESPAEKNNLSKSDTNKTATSTTSPVKELKSTKSLMDKINSECKVVVEELQTLVDNKKEVKKQENQSITKAVTECKLSSEKIVEITKSPVQTKRLSTPISQVTEQQLKHLSKSDAIVSEIKDIDEDVKNQSSTPHKKNDSQQSNTVKLAVNNQSPSTTTPLKSAHKPLKQTQLPFTPMRKQLESNSESSSNTKPKDNNETHEKNTLHPKYIDDLQCRTNSTIDNLPMSNLDSGEAKGVKLENVSENKMESDSYITKEAPRTPEKSPQTANVDIIEIGASEEVDEQSPTTVEESEDVIASSQESDFTKESFSVCERSNKGSNNSPPKLQSKSPKQSLAASLSDTCSDRVLRSSPVKTDTLRFSVTPKKSVCRRLDVEDKSNESASATGTNICGKKEIPNPTDKVVPETEDIKGSIEQTNCDLGEELLNDIKLLNGENKKVDVHSREIEETLVMPDKPNLLKFENKIEPSTSSANTSPISHGNLKRFLTEPSSGPVESPKRSLSLMRLESAGSPKSPSSRTSQIMELAMQDKEKTISSPVGSVKRRRILPVKLGPILRSTQPQSPSVTLRTHPGPSEQWVRRTYSPAASPNSSILKRRQSDHQLISPDSSPPSTKKKRVSFLDPPVSESLLFSKAIPGKGEIHRPECKPETESEEFVSQGSVQILPSPAGQTSVFSPLKHCPHSLADIIERIVSQQWASELESQLERLGVTTVGQLSALSEATIQRLPFIPPKIERLQKILQNYYNEINEKPDISKPETMEVTEDNETPSVLSDIPIISTPEMTQDARTPDEVLNTEAPQSRSEENLEEKRTGKEENLEENRTGKDEHIEAKISGTEENSVIELAETVRQTLVENPSLITELGNKLDVNVIMSILNIAVTKLKNQHDVR